MIDANDLTIEQLEQELDRAARGEPVSIEDVEQEDTQEAGQEPEPTPEPEAEVEEQAEAEPASQETEAQAEEPKEPDYDKEHMQSMLAEFEARAKHWEQVAGRHGGEIGFLKQKLASMSQPRPQSSDQEFEAEEPSETVRQPQTRSDDTLKSWAVKRAAQDALAAFHQKHSDAQEALPKVAEYLQKIGYRPDDILYADDPATAERETTRVLEEAYWAVRADVEAARRAELAAQRAEQTAKAAEAKKKAAVSASGAMPPKKPQGKKLEDMTLEELEAAIQKETGGRW